MGVEPFYRLKFGAVQLQLRVRLTISWRKEGYWALPASKPATFLPLGYPFSHSLIKLTSGNQGRLCRNFRITLHGPIDEYDMPSICSFDPSCQPAYTLSFMKSSAAPFKVRSLGLLGSVSLGPRYVPPGLCIVPWRPLGGINKDLSVEPKQPMNTSEIHCRVRILKLSLL